jgi:hypothetical protein
MLWAMLSNPQAYVKHLFFRCRMPDAKAVFFTASIRSLHTGSHAAVIELRYISLSVETLRIQFIIGRYGNLPYRGVCPKKNYQYKRLEKHAFCERSEQTCKLVYFEPDLLIRRNFTTQS